MTLEDRVLVDLHRAASVAGRPGIAVPSVDLQIATDRIGNQRARDALKRLVQSGRVESVRQDLVVLPDSTARVTVDLADLIKVVAPPLHLITGSRALEEHQLTNQHAFTTFVLVPSPLRSFSFRGEKAAFITTRTERIWGWQSRGAHYAVPERAIIDAVSSPRYGVSLPMAIRALYTVAGRDPKFLTRLVKATQRYKSHSVSRRLGLLVERLLGDGAAQPFRELIGTSRTPVSLRPGGTTDGPVDRVWRIIVNASTELQGVNG